MNESDCEIFGEFKKLYDTSKSVWINKIYLIEKDLPLALNLPVKNLCEQLYY